MEQSAYTENTGNAEKAASTSSTSRLKKQKDLQVASQPITPEDILMMVQALLNKMDSEIPGVSVKRTTIYVEGQQIAAAVFFGCTWDDVGNLVMASPAKVGNVGNEAT